MWWRYYVYQHRRADDGRVFYIGKGTVKAKHKKPVYERAYERESRNAHWRRTVSKHGLIVEIIASFATDGDSQTFEREMIATYGRSNLANLTDGGDGCSGIVMSQEARRKLSEHAKKPRSEAWVKSIRAARKNGGNGGVVKSGDKLPDWWKQRIAVTKVGEKNPMHGRTGEFHPRSRRVLDSVSGATYPSVNTAAGALGLNMKTLYNMLSGHRPNRTNLRFA